MRISPTIEGFRAAFRRPSLTFAEIAWRWTVGGVASAVLFFAGIEFLDSLPVKRSDAVILRTKQPVLIARAIAHILHGSLDRVAFTTLAVLLSAALLWIALASAGRAAIMRALLDYFRSTDVLAQRKSRSRLAALRTLTGLNFFRVAAALGSILAVVGAAILAGYASPAKNPHPALVFILFVPAATLICSVWYALNWLLSLSAVFAVRDDVDTLGCISEATSLLRERPGALAAVTIWTAIAHLVAFSVATSALSVPMVFLQFAPAGPVLFVTALLALAYFAVADWLYIVRTAGYIHIVEFPYQVTSPSPISQITDSDARRDIQITTTIDRDETILSDHPVLYTAHPI